MKCQLFPFFEILLALAFAPGYGLLSRALRMRRWWQATSQFWRANADGLKTLRGADINIVAIHQHMTGENPRIIFLHYYGRGKALSLAEGRWQQTNESRGPRQN